MGVTAARMSVHVFIGPTLPAEAVTSVVPGALVHPPVSHGDLLRLPLARGDVVAIVDGLFHHTASVRHKEILALLAEGVSVIGCSSMGALRAAELASFGMIGNGAVFDMYHTGSIYADDEVAVAHTEAPSYRRLSEALVTFRYVTAEAVRVGVVDESAARAILAAARGIHYTSRSWRAVEAVADRSHRDLAATVRRLQVFAHSRPDCRDIKAFDARQTLAQIESLASAVAGPAPTWGASQGWRRGHLANWQAEFLETRVDGNRVRVADMLRYEQLYDPEFPVRWRRYALEQIRSSPRPAGAAASGGPAARALDVAASWGLTPESLPREQSGQWLTEHELALPDNERLLLVLVRSFRRCGMAFELLTGGANLLVGQGSQRAVAEAYVVNNEVASRRPERSITRIKRTRLRQHLADTWGVRVGDDRGLLAGARDRGFSTLAEGLEAARPFLLRHHLRSRGLPLTEVW
jgi:hypothetical protein